MLVIIQVDPKYLTQLYNYDKTMTIGTRYGFGRKPVSVLSTIHFCISLASVIICTYCVLTAFQRPDLLIILVWDPTTRSIIFSHPLFVIAFHLEDYEFMTEPRRSKTSLPNKARLSLHECTFSSYVSQQPPCIRSWNTWGSHFPTLPQPSIAEPICKVENWKWLRPVNEKCSMQD